MYFARQGVAIAGIELAGNSRLTYRAHDSLLAMEF
jgi:hypothetical protein